MKKFSSMPIRIQLLILAVLMAVPAFGVTIYSGLKLRSYDYRAAEINTQHLADNLADILDHLTGESRLLGDLLSGLPDIKNRNKGKVQSILSQITKKHPEYQSIFIADRDGTVWVASGPVTQAASVADRRYFTKVKSTMRFSSGEYSDHIPPGSPSISMAYPLVGDDKTFDGAIILIFDLDVMRAILQRSGLPGDTNYVLVDHQGIVISRGREAGQVVGKPVTPEAMKQMLEGPDSKTTSFVRQGDKRVVSYRKLWLQGEESPYLYVRVGISTVQVLGRANRQMIFTLSMLSSCILVAFMLAVWTGKRSIADKVEALRDASQKIAAGDLTVRIAHRIEGGELGELAHSFDEMAISLSKSNEERTRHERELSQYADIVTNMQVGLYVYQLESRDDDRSLRLVAANPRASGLLGLTEHDLVGRTIDDIFPNLRQAGIPGKFAEVVRTGQSLAVDDFVYTDQNVGEAAFAFKVFPLPDNCVGVLFEDISPRKKAETSLHELNKELEQRVAQRTMELNTLNAELAAFNYSVSHDMRAPLIRIKGYADVLLETGAPKLSEEESYYLSRLKAAIDRLDNHIEALIKLYQFTRVDFYREPVDITALSWSILSGLHDLDPDRTVAVTVADGMVTEADRVLMTGLLDNLIGNAWKYTSGKAAASIEVGVTKQEGGEVYFVRDNGVGFDMDQVENVFTPFLRLHQDDSGLGIGLASAQRIVRLHGGRIWAESREGEGATFYFTLRS